MRPSAGDLVTIEKFQFVVLATFGVYAWVRRTDHDTSRPKTWVFNIATYRPDAV